jgi:hypothetical protein
MTLAQVPSLPANWRITHHKERKRRGH